MSIKIYSSKEQANGNFNNGEILEKKPIGFTQDGGELKPYSNIFYWADAWTPSSRTVLPPQWTRRTTDRGERSNRGA